MKNRIKLATIVLIMLISISCTVKYVPIPIKGINIENDFAIKKTKEYTIAVENRYWIKDPQELSDYFTTFYITIKNRSSQDIKITKSDITLLDENGNQFDTVDLEYIEKMLLPRQMEYLMISNIDDNNLTDTLSDNPIDELLNDQRDYLEKWRKSKQNLMTYSFQFGKLQAGAQKSGFIYFPRLDSNNIRCKISYKNEQIQFVRSDYLDKMTTGEKRIEE